jgi:hypothetical protein
MAATEKEASQVLRGVPGITQALAGIFWYNHDDASVHLLQQLSDIERRREEA